MTPPILELRNYLLARHMRDHFIDYFETHFIASQIAVNMQILGQFRVLNQPDHFVWLRGFDTMESRRESLTNFYDGPVWKKYGRGANSMLLDSDNVHLLRPVSHGIDLTCDYDVERISRELDAGTLPLETGIIAVDFYQALPGQRSASSATFQQQVAPIFARIGVRLCGIFVAEMRENTFPRLPAFQNENELVVMTAFESEADYYKKRDQVQPHLLALEPLFAAARETLLLSPTLRSPLRYLPNAESE